MPDDDLEALFGDLRPERRVSDKTAKILEYGPVMLKARGEGVTWKQLAGRLDRIGLKVSPEYLRALMERHAATIGAVPKAGRKAMPPVLVVKGTRSPRQSRGEPKGDPPAPGMAQCEFSGCERLGPNRNGPGIMPYHVCDEHDAQMGPPPPRPFAAPLKTPNWDEHAADRRADYKP